MGAEFMEQLRKCMKYDRFIKVIDVSQNHIDESSLKSFIKYALKEN